MLVVALGDLELGMCLLPPCGSLMYNSCRIGNEESLGIGHCLDFQRLTLSFDELTLSVSPLGQKGDGLFFKDVKWRLRRWSF